MPTSQRRRGRRGPHGEQGETLIELLVTIAIMSTAVVAIVGGLMVAIRVSDLHRKQVTAGAAVRAFAEKLEQAVDGTPSGYVDCASTASYTSIANAITTQYAGFTATITSADGHPIKYWNSSTSTFVTTCPETDQGLQQISIQVSGTSSMGKVTEKLNVVLRKPCATAGSGDGEGGEGGEGGGGCGSGEGGGG
jgi:type II secretory pathway pseudopilin PulG